MSAARSRAGRPLLLALALCLGCGAEPGSGAASPVERPDVILVCLDTVRADHLGCYGYATRPTTPTLDRLAGDGLLFLDVTAASGWTKPSVPSFFTGTWPIQHGVYEGSVLRDGALSTDLLGQDVTTLAEVFADAGYDTAAFVRNAQLRAGRGFEQGFATYVDAAGDARALCSSALAWLDDRAARGDERPCFLYLHLLDAHWPYDIPDEAAARFASPGTLERIRDGDWRSLRDEINDGDVTLSDAERAEIVALYDAGIRFMDDELGRLLAAVDARAAGRRPLVSVVADHGEEFLEHGRIGHGHGLWENLTRVGWLLAGPGIDPGRVETPVSLVDLFPTLLAAAGLGAGDDLPSVDRLARPDAAGRLFAEHKSPDGYWQSLRDGPLKLVRRYRTRRPDDVDALALLAAGGFWEAELRDTPDGRWIADQLKPRDEDAASPPELKAPIAERSASTLTLAGVTARIDADTQVSGAADLSAAHVGRLAKLRFVDGADGVPRAERVKLYAQAVDEPPEVRGAAGALTLDADGLGGSVELGGFPVAFDAQTRWKDLPGEAPRPRLRRTDILALLRDGPGEQLEVRWELYDLSHDPRELAPIEVARDTLTNASPELRRLDEQLLRLSSGLAAHRAWSTGAAQLEDDAIDDLKALGYLR